MTNEYEGCQYPQEPCSCEKEYKNFSKQDLIDRRDALREERMDVSDRREEIGEEIDRINKLLEALAIRGLRNSEQ